MLCVTTKNKNLKKWGDDVNPNGLNAIFCVKPYVETQCFASPTKNKN